MELFLDTNVIVGYSIELDKWHFSAKRLFDKNIALYWSDTVRKESKGKIKELNYFYLGFLNKLNENISSDFICKKDFLEIANEIKFINKKEVPFNPKDMAALIWINGGWFEEVSKIEIGEFIKKFQSSILKTTLPNFNYCDENLILHTRTLNPNYQKLVEKLELIKDKKDKIHNPDSEILVDCYDLTISENKEVIFVSSDKKLLKFKKDILNIIKLFDMIFIDDAYHYIDN